MSADQILPIFFTFIGLVMVVYVFAFTIYNSFLNGLYGLNKESINKHIDVDEKVRNRIEKSSSYGGTWMQLALVWCIFSALIGIFGIKLLLLTDNGLNAASWILLTRLTSGLLGISILIVFYIYQLKAKKMIKKCTMILLVCILIAISFWVFFKFNCVNYLAICLLWLMFGMILILIFWFTSTIITKPLISLQKLRKKVLSHMNKKKIMLVNISVPYEFAGAPADVSLEQIGLGYLAAVLKEKGHNVCLYDAYSREDSESEIIKNIENYEPDFICLSPTCFSWDRTIRISQDAKRSKRSIKTVFGGPHVSFEPVLTRALREFDCIDYLVRGEGERSIIPVVENIDKKTIGNTPGVCYRNKDGTLHISNELSEQVENLDELPFPLRDIEPLSGKSLRITTSRGCYSNGKGCSFCQMPLQNPHGWRCRSPKNVVDEIEFWAKKGHRSFVCAEGDFLGLSKYGIKRAGKIGEEILRRNLNIRLRVFGGIPGIIAAEKKGVLSTLKKAGLERMYPGIEAGNEEDLELYEKNITIDQIKTAIDILKRKRIGLQIGFIMFNPWSNSKRLIANVSLLKQIDQAHLWFNFAYRLGLYPGIRLLDKVCEEGLLIDSMEKVGLGSELVHNYRFKVPYIAQIADACAEILRAEVVIRADRLLITAGVLTSDSALNENSYPLDSRKSNIKREYEKYKNVIANLNTITFFSILELCERGGSDKKLKNFVSSHLIKINEILPDIKKLCSGVIIPTI